MHRFTVLVAAAVSAAFLAQTYGHDSKPPAKTKEQIEYRLVRITIPPDSPIRRQANINKPPEMYVILRDRGEQIGKTSTARRGWDVDFERTAARNRWLIWDYTPEKIYSIEIWDSNWFRDDLILSITGISGQHFRETIREKGSINLPEDRLTTIDFSRISENAEPKSK